MKGGLKMKLTLKENSMERVTDINVLKKGDKIVRVYGDRVVIREFICIHPHNEKYSLFIDENYDGIPKFYNENLLSEQWYSFNDSKDDWKEIIYKQIEWYNKELNRLSSRIKEGT